MRPTKALLGSLILAGLIAAPLSSASARGWHHHRGFGGGFGVLGGLVVGAAAIATAPLAIIAGAGEGRDYGPRSGYGNSGYDNYGPSGGYYGPPGGYYAPPRPYYPPPRYYGPPPGYYSQSPQYYGPAPGY